MFDKMCDHSSGWRPEDGVPDLAMMSDITHQGINVNLRTRYQRDQIYTYSGSILIAVNPYKQLDIYNQRWIDKFRERNFDQTEPHVFAIAEAMYKSLIMQTPTSTMDTKSSPSVSLTCSSLSSSTSSSTSNLHRGNSSQKLDLTNNNNNVHEQSIFQSNSDQQPSRAIVCQRLTKNQACVISGESGAGKTETAKFILSYLCSVSPNKSTWMEYQILEATTILEAFGNAKTVRNDNSSRFGKFIQICFDSRNEINGCIIQDYLLEQSRITYQSIGERNYHVFYQLLSAGQTNQELRKKFHLMPANFYDYLNKTQCFTIDGVDDCAMFDSLRMAMSVLNMEQESCDCLFSVLSAILWLGNLQFEICDDEDRNSANEECKLANNDEQIVGIIAELLGVERAKLVPVMLRRQINVRGAITEIPFKLHEARDNRNAMAKALYSRLFTWVVNFINASTNPSQSNLAFLGVLDIFGFENFSTNSFEQLCINYANEKLHKFFNHHMFATEQELYKLEGIEFCDINYTDNTACLELLERPPSCVLRLLSEECRMPKGTDLTFIEKLHAEFSSPANPHPFYVKGVDRRNWSSEFAVRHFAGSVKYNVEGFLKKNKDAQQSQLLDLIETSEKALLRDLVSCVGLHTDTSNKSSESNQPRTAKLHAQQSFCVAPNDVPNHIKVRRGSSFSSDASKIVANSSIKSRPTVADTFRLQLTSLVDLLNTVNPWYVRCIKPNLEKSATDYDNEQVLIQLNYLGMSDLIRIRREGFPIHLTKHQFVCRYRCLMLRQSSFSPIKMQDETLDLQCLKIINHFQLSKSEWRVGKTRVLLRSNVYQPLEDKRARLFNEMATLVQSHWRRFVVQRRYRQARSAAVRIQDSFRAYRGRLLYLRKKRAALTIQAFVRGMFAREIANALREIKRIELEKAKQREDEARAKEQAEIEEQDRMREERDSNVMAIAQSKSVVETNCADPQIVITNCDHKANNDTAPEVTTEGAERPPSKNSDHSPAISSSVSWTHNDADSSTEARIKAMKRDKMEMDDLVKVLERHGISLNAEERTMDDVYADFEKLYDVLGNQLQVNGDAQSVSPSVNDDDRISFATIGTTCDGDSISCSGRSNISSTTGDENTYNERINQETPQEMTREDSANMDQDATLHTLGDAKYTSNSIESIASIISSTSTQSNAPQTTLAGERDDQAVSDTSQATTTERSSTFTGNTIMLSGSKLVTNGRPLTRIEEEPNSTSTTPCRTPHRKRADSRAESLFPPELGPTSENETNNPCLENKRRRLERKILQVQQEQEQQILPVQPTTAGLPMKEPSQDVKSNDDTNSEKQIPNGIYSGSETSSDNIYGMQKQSILDYVEKILNHHPRETNSNGVIRTLTRRRKSVDACGMDVLTTGEMLSYNANFNIPTSHVKMHDPMNAQISCTMFKNLCRYMTGESAKNDAELRIIQSIIRHGIEKTDLRDEIYIQITRQLTNNPNSEYCLRLWVLLGLVSAAFPPSKQLASHLIAYLRGKPRKDPSITCYAQYCLDNMQTARLYPRKCPPSLLEVQACKTLTNLKCNIHFLDERCEAIDVHPCDTALDIMTKLAHKINLQSIEGWALYESYTPGLSKFAHPSFEHKGDYERSARSHQYVADILAVWQDGVTGKSNTSLSLKVAQKLVDESNFKLTFKKRIFRGPKIRNDPVEINLLYAQAVHNVVKKDNFLVDENLAVSLAGLQAQIKLGNLIDLIQHGDASKKHKSSSKTLVKSSLYIYDVESLICSRLRHHVNRSKKEWSAMIMHAHKQYHDVSEIFCKMRYLSMVIYHCPLYGTATFPAIYRGYQTLAQNLKIGVNAEGILLIRSSDRALISAYRYSDLNNETGVVIYADENLIQLSVRDRSDNKTKCLSFECHEHEEIAMLMTSYHGALKLNIRGNSTLFNQNVDNNIDQNVIRRRNKLKMTLEDRMRTHQEVQNARRAIVRTGKLRKPEVDENPGLIRHTLKRLSTGRGRGDKPSRFENVYGTLRSGNRTLSEIPQTSSDYNIYGYARTPATSDSATATKAPLIEVAGATASKTNDDLMKPFSHRYWAYTNAPLRNSLLIIHAPELEEAALTNFNAILTYSGLLSGSINNVDVNMSADGGSTDSGIASNLSGKTNTDSVSSASPNEIYDMCPRKLDESELIKLAQSILDRCLRKDADILKNEFFLQLIKQTTDHPDPSSEINLRHWQLLALACSVTYPSDVKILSYLHAHLRRCALDQVSLEGQYSLFTLRSLQGTLDTKGRRHAPSESEISSTINCRRVYARVYFLDGQFQAVEFDPCATIAEVVEQIKQKIGLRPDCEGYTLFQPLDDDCEQVVHADEKVGDAIASWEFYQKERNSKDYKQIQMVQNQGSKPSKASLASLANGAKSRTHRFVFKRYLWCDSMIDLSDPVECELLYYQIVSTIRDGKFPVLEQEATILCSLKAQIEIGDYTKLVNLSKENIRMIYKQVVMSLMPPQAYNNLSIPAIAQQHQTFRDLSCADTKKYFFNLIQSFGRANLSQNSGCILLHRASIYDATQTFASAWPSDIWIVVNQTGIHILVAKTRKMLASCEYRQIVDQNANNNYLVVVSLNGAQSRLIYTFYTKHAQQIAQQMRDYMAHANSNKSKRKKSVEFNLKQSPRQTDCRAQTIKTPINCQQ